MLSFHDGRDPLIQQFWDEAGQQLVVDHARPLPKRIVFGTQEWYRDELRLDIADWEEYSRAEKYELGAVCPPKK